MHIVGVCVCCSISDKDAAMQQKRRDKVELKMQDFTNANGGPDSGTHPTNIKMIQFIDIGS